MTALTGFMHFAVAHAVVVVPIVWGGTAALIWAVVHGGRKAGGES